MSQQIIGKSMPSQNRSLAAVSSLFRVLTHSLSLIVDEMGARIDELEVQVKDRVEATKKVTGESQPPSESS